MDEYKHLWKFRDKAHSGFADLEVKGDRTSCGIIEIICL